MRKFMTIVGSILLLLTACNTKKEEPKVEEVVISASEVAGYYADSLIYGDNTKYQEYSGVDMSIQDKEAYEGAIQHFIDNYSMAEYTLTREDVAEAVDAFNEAIRTYAKYEIIEEKIENDKALVTLNCWSVNTSAYKKTLEQDFKDYLMTSEQELSDRDRSLWLINYRIDYYKNKTFQVTPPILYEMVLNKENNLWIPAKENETELSKIMQTS